MVIKVKELKYQKKWLPKGQPPYSILNFEIILSQISYTDYHLILLSKCLGSNSLF